MRGRSELAPAPPARFVLPARSTGVLSADERARALGFVRALLSAPTAPYFEDGPSRVVRAFAAERPGLELCADEHANLIVTWPGTARRAKGAPVLAYSAHLDHPGFHALGTRRGVVRASFHGGVPASSMPGAPVRFHDARDGRALGTAVVKRTENLDGATIAELDDVRGRIPRGSFGVFDLSDGRMRGTRLHARVCDDLMGAAAILATLDHAVRARSPEPLVGIFTRAEETGFVGCLGLLRSRALARGTLVVGLECSPRRSTAVVGGGPVIRVGDRQSVFDPAITLELEAAAARVAERVPGFRVQRALMDGGSCESTAYNHHGVRAGAMCLALGNYHNCAPQHAIGPEFVDWDDFEGLVAVMVETTRDFGRGGAAARMQARLDRIWDRESGRLHASSARLAEPPARRGRENGTKEEETRR